MFVSLNLECPLRILITFLLASELGHYLHPCEDDLVCKCTNEKVPYFNAPVFLDNKQQIGKVDEIFGPIRDFVSFFLKKLGTCIPILTMISLY